ncbi:SMI1/KNR4 family protein [Streptomyces sp. JL2001]|uniref:SMI1/KNR4 family protein n=1 Tax=unclassified Streptomyces TaxID=2593676 RepID=UPI0033A33599
MTDYSAQLSEVLERLGNGGDRLDWGSVEVEYGVRFPQDYVDFVARFGDGSIEETLWVAIPAPASDLAARRVDRVPEEVIEFPEANEWADARAAEKYRLEDLLVWGETDEADILCWIAEESDPDRWPVAVFSRSDAVWRVYECGMSEFIVRLLRAEFDPCPISTRRLSGLSRPRFLHTREEMRLREAGVNPWLQR